MRTTKSTFPNETDCGVPGTYATDGYGWPLFVVPEHYLPWRAGKPCPPPSVKVNGEAYYVASEPKHGTVTFKRGLHVGDLLSSSYCYGVVTLLAFAGDTIKVRNDVGTAYHDRPEDYVGYKPRPEHYEAFEENTEPQSHCVPAGGNHNVAISDPIAGDDSVPWFPR